MVELYRALAAVGEAPLSAEQLAVGLAAMDDKLVFRPKGDHWTDALLVPIVGFALRGAQVHVVTASETEALTLRYRWNELLSELGLSHDALVDSDDKAARKTKHGCKVLFGSHHQFCRNFLLAHAASRPAEFESSGGGRVVLTDGTAVLLEEATTRVVFRHEELIQTAIRTRSYFSNQGRLCGFLTGSWAASRLLRSWYGVDTVEVVRDSATPDTTLIDLAVRLREQEYELTRLEEEGNLQQLRLIDRALTGKPVGAIVTRIFDMAIEDALTTADSPAHAADDVRDLFFRASGSARPAAGMTVDEMREVLRDEVRWAHRKREAEVGLDILRRYERRALVGVMHHEWKAHLQRLDAHCPVADLGKLLPRHAVAEYQDFSAASCRVFMYDATRSIVRLIFFADLGEVQSEAELWLADDI